ncbi:MAG: hypothetical protein HQ515_00695 [Phycisphaeraceae bacterium]|nr:hypothetical protein [Phycisphaeraceae bacterium]
MLKIIGVLAGGIFVGAVGIEIIGEKYPRMMAKARKKVRRGIWETKDTLRDGYHKVIGLA